MNSQKEYGREKLMVSDEVVRRLVTVLERMKELEESGRTNSVEYFRLSVEKNDIEEEYSLMDIIFEENGKKGIKDIRGTVRVPAIYEGYAVLYSFLSFRSTPVIAQDVNGMFAIVKADGSGTPITAFEYDYMDIEPYSKLFIAGKNGKCALMDKDGKILTPFELDAVVRDLPINGHIEVKKSDKLGIYNYCMNLYIPPVYDEIVDHTDGWVYVRLGDRWGFLTNEGRFIDETDEEAVEDNSLLYWYEI